MRTVVTGEAVELHLPAVSPITRGASLLIDLIVAWIAFGLLIWIGFSAAAQNPMAVNEAVVAAYSIGSLVAALVILPITVEVLSRGRSLGKLIFGIQLVRDDGGSIRLRHAVIRWLVGFGEIYFTLGLMPLITGVATSRSRRMGDVMAGTYAVQARPPVVRPMMLPVPQPMASWAQIADIGRIPDDLAARAARLLRVIEHGGRARNMPALTAAADRLAQELVPYVAPMPPASSAFEFLAGVIAERRNREYQRLVRTQVQQAQLSQRVHALPYA